MNVHLGVLAGGSCTSRARLCQCSESVLVLPIRLDPARAGVKPRVHPQGIASLASGQPRVFEQMGELGEQMGACRPVPCLQVQAAGGQGAGGFPAGGTRAGHRQPLLHGGFTADVWWPMRAATTVQRECPHSTTSETFGSLSTCSMAAISLETIPETYGLAERPGAGSACRTLTRHSRSGASRFRRTGRRSSSRTLFQLTSTRGLHRYSASRRATRYAGTATTKSKRHPIARASGVLICSEPIRTPGSRPAP